VTAILPQFENDDKLGNTGITKARWQKSHAQKLFSALNI